MSDDRLATEEDLRISIRDGDAIYQRNNARFAEFTRKDFAHLSGEYWVKPANRVIYHIYRPAAERDLEPTQQGLWSSGTPYQIRQAFLLVFLDGDKILQLAYEPMFNAWAVEVRIPQTIGAVWGSEQLELPFAHLDLALRSN